MRFFFLLFVMLISATHLFAADFSFHQQQGTRQGSTLLVIGGIDGDEPGGFHAAATLVTHYQVQRGNLWIVPNLNFESILKRQRGNMNLKFASISKHDHQYQQVQQIKKIITQPQVDLILNLHDGSGFYHPERINSQRNPNRWGQSCVIDQSRIENVRFGNLEHLAEIIIQQINSKTSTQGQNFLLKNMHTATDRKAIAAKKSLSYFAVRNQKPCLSVEASKTHSVSLRTYYHLLALEATMQQMGIHFTRDFQLTPQGVKQIIKDDAVLALVGGRVQLELNNMRTTIKNFPLPETGTPKFTANNPLITLLPADNRYRIHYGNNRLAFINPHFVDLDRSIDSVKMVIDGMLQSVSFGSIVPVKKNFLVKEQQGYRVNVVGFSKPGHPNDGHLPISHAQLKQSYSIDKAGQLYRVEIYRNERFSGMILVDFRQKSVRKEPLIARIHPINLESDQQYN
ncbi:MAG: hypothetical protein L3J57_14860 [Desulfuromusa sp.]|nr:hypothetical protein [Desulfuromusa sp.]